MTRLRTYAATGLLVAATALTLPVAASASTPPTPDATATTETPAPSATTLQRLETACTRVPLVQARVDRAVTLLDGDAGQRGSIAWLDAQLQTARDRGRTELVTVLENRITVRTSRLALLEARSTELVDLASLCDAHGFGG